MAIRHAILGILLQRPSYPYELSVRFDQLVGFAWQLSRSQVYQTVERLRHEGLVERVANKPAARGPRWTYRVTEAGRQEFERWRATTSTKPRPVRDELLVKIALGTQDDAQGLLEAIRLRRLLIAERLRDHSEAQARLYPPREPRTWQDVGPALSMSAVLTQLNSELACLDAAQATLERLGGQSRGGARQPQDRRRRAASRSARDAR